MSTTITSPVVPPCPRTGNPTAARTPSLAAAVSGALRRAITATRAARAERQTRIALAGLDDYILRDIGYTRAAQAPWRCQAEGALANLDIAVLRDPGHVRVMSIVANAGLVRF